MKSSLSMKAPAVYRSAVDIWSFWPSLLYVTFVLTVTLLSQRWFFIALLAMPVGAIAGKYFSTRYTIFDDGRLEITSHAQKQKKVIDIRSITYISHIDSVASAPALSKRRLEIRFNAAEKISISPKDTPRFIRELSQIHPDIKID